MGFFKRLFRLKFKEQEVQKELDEIMRLNKYAVQQLNDAYGKLKFALTQKQIDEAISDINHAEAKLSLIRENVARIAPNKNGSLGVSA